MARRRRRQPAPQRFWPLPGLLILGAVVGVAVVAGFFLLRPPPPEAGGARDNSLGLATAAVVVEEWGDFQ